MLNGEWKKAGIYKVIKNKNGSNLKMENLKGQKKTKIFFYEISAIFQNYKLEFVLCVIGITLCCAFFKYIDGITIQSHALETGDAIFRGGYSGFYEILSQDLWNAPHGELNGAFTVSNLLYTVWNLPALLIHYIFETGYYISFISRMWGKLFFVLLDILCGYIIDKIILKLTNDNKRGMIAAVLFWSSISVIVSVGYAMQDEILYIFFVLMGLNDAVSDKKISSLIWLSLSCFTCPLVFIIAIPVVLFLSEKMIDIICRVLVLLCVTALQIQYLNSSGAVSSENEIWKIFDISFFSFGIGKISLLAVAMCLLYMLQWNIEFDDKKEKIQYLFWDLSFLSILICILGEVAYYRFVICTPFVILSLMFLDDTEKQKSAILSLLLFEIFSMWIKGVTSTFLWLSALPNFARQFFGLNSYPNITIPSLLCMIFPQITNTLTIMCGFEVAFGIWLLYLCHPKQKVKITCRIKIKTLTVIWAGLPTLLVLLVSVFLVKANLLDVTLNVNLSNLQKAEITSAIDGEKYLEEYYCGKAANRLLITVIPYTTVGKLPSGQKLNVDIIDVGSGETVSSQSYDAGKIKSGEKITYHIEGIKLKKDHWYKLKFYSPDLIENEEHYMWLFRSAEGSADPEHHYAKDFSDATCFDIVSQIVTF